MHSRRQNLGNESPCRLVHRLDDRRLFALERPLAPPLLGGRSGLREQYADHSARHTLTRHHQSP
jgi:hypothetical protein